MLHKMKIDWADGKHTRFQRRPNKLRNSSDSDTEESEDIPKLKYKKETLWANVLCCELTYA